jgi:glycosyltransferase involved in cell wall biosynthesis
MRILFLSSLCSTALLPHRSPGNARILRALRNLAECRAIIPLPWHPGWLARLAPQWRATNSVPRVERDSDGSLIMHPRTLHVPRVGRFLYGALYAASVAPVVRREVARFRPDVILSAWAYPDGTAAVALGRALGVPVVVRTMGSDINQVAQKAGRRCQIRWALRRAGRVVAVSRALSDRICALGVPRERVSIIPTGVDRSVFHPLDRQRARHDLGLADGPVVLVPARLSPEKGLMHLMEAMSLSRERCPATLLLVGDGRQRRALEDEAATRRLAVRFEGLQPEARMPLYYAAADVVCLPSLEEGWPDALMESFACGCPVVATQVGGMPDIVALTGAGRLVPPGQAAPLADALCETLSRAWDRGRIAQVMEGHSIEHTARRYLDACAAARESP